MSHVTSVTVVTLLGEDDAMAFVNMKLLEADDSRQQQLVKVDGGQEGGGTKCSSLETWAA